MSPDKNALLKQKVGEKLTLKQFYNQLFSNRILVAIISTGLLILIASLWRRYIHVDEPWLGEQAYWLAKEGIVKLETMKGIGNFSERMFVYHKFYVILGALLIKAFGWSVYIFKFQTLIIYLLFFLIFYLYHKENSSKITRRYFLIACTLIFVNPITLVFSFTYRPEILVMTLGFLSFFFLNKNIKSGKIQFAALAGIFSGLAFFTHLNGLIFSVAGFFLLVFFKKYRAVGYFTITSCVVSLFYTYDLWAPGNLETMVYEFKNYPLFQFGEKQLNSGITGFLEARLESLFYEHKRYLWSYYVFPLSILFWIALAANFRILKRNFQSLLVYTLILIFSLAFLSSYKAQHYLIYFYPYMALIIAIGILKAQIFNKKLLMIIYLALFSLQLFYLPYELNKIIVRNENVIDKHATVLANVPALQGERILVPWEFIYNELPDYNLVNDLTYKFPQMERGQQLSQVSFFKRAIDLNVQYIVYDKIFYSIDQEWQIGDKLQENPYFKQIHEVNEYLILERK
ncbi:hypothetical protein BH23BAC1_BH23BAC1_29950 [soil metagenome]